MRALVLACSAVMCAAPAARAYRPFDGTDAAVADHGDLEIELGPAPTGAAAARLADTQLRPVFELFTEFRTPDRWELTGLGGLIWHLSDRWALDAGLRGGSADGEALFLVRVGVTVAADVLGSRSQSAVASSGQQAHLPSR